MSARGSKRLALTAWTTFELDVVSKCTMCAHWTAGRWLAILVSKLGNGWLYPILAIAALATMGRGVIPVILIACLNVAVGQALLQLLKAGSRRARPYQVAPGLVSLLPVQDPSSFPSGHMMTLTAVLIPLIFVLPPALPAAAVLWPLMAWSRLVSAHHYPSDIVAGVVLGLCVALPISHVLLSVIAPTFAAS
jgi:undecaprenyl-diphosphatase